MKVTDVKLRTLEDRGKMKAIGSITLDGAFVVSGVGVVEGSKGLFVSMPSVKGADGKYYDSAYPLDKELREDIHRAVMDRFQRDQDIDRIIETVELGNNSDGNEPKEKGNDSRKPEKASVRDKLKDASEKAGSQPTKVNEKKKKEMFL